MSDFQFASAVSVTANCNLPTAQAKESADECCRSTESHSLILQHYMFELARGLQTKGSRVFAAVLSGGESVHTSPLKSVISQQLISKTPHKEAPERYESAYRIMIRIACQTAKLLKSRDFGAPNCGFDTLIHYALKLPEAVF
ncbi:hypothetical protein DPX16_18380 [Anabarilius grahami]|uniref:Uncharacterized protein n=1 Tax=Anabarilius grahami TaxID=495550 RepID=A0A3N0YEI2_ANAGA|nr:hypothetical protein DPX16_18380 [Anabarilius grahami]